MELFTSSSAGKVVVKTKDLLIVSCKCLPLPPPDAQDTVLGTMRKTDVPLLGACGCPKRYLGQKQRAVSCPALSSAMMSPCASVSPSVKWRGLTRKSRGVSNSRKGWERKAERGPV